LRSALFLPSSLNRGKKAGLVIKEQKWAEVDGDRVKEISSMWLESKACKKRELQCSTWPAIYEDEWRQRKFYVYEKEGGKMVAFIWWLPCWKDGKVVGYTANCLRQDTDKGLDCHNYVLNYAFLACVEMFKAEGRAFAALGGAYGADVQEEEGDSKVVRAMAKWAYKHMSRFYNLKGLSDHKDLYHANRQSKLYSCHKGPYSELVYLIMPYIASGAIPYLSTGLFGKGVFVHKEEKALFLRRLSMSHHQSSILPPEEQKEMKEEAEPEEGEKKPKWQPTKRDGPKMTKRQRKRLAKQQQEQGGQEQEGEQQQQEPEVVEPQKPISLIKKATNSILGTISRHKTHIKEEEDIDLRDPVALTKLLSHQSSFRSFDDPKAITSFHQLASLVVMMPTIELEEGEEEEEEANQEEVKCSDE